MVGKLDPVVLFLDPDGAGRFGQGSLKCSDRDAKVARSHFQRPIHRRPACCTKMIADPPTAVRGPIPDLILPGNRQIIAFEIRTNPERAAGTTLTSPTIAGHNKFRVFAGLNDQSPALTACAMRDLLLLNLTRQP